MKKILITSTDLMMIQFLVPHVRYLSEHGYHVEIACSVVGGRIDDVRRAVEGFARAIHIVRLERSPASPNNLKGYGDMKRLLAENHYDIIWTNEPVMGVVTRLAAKKLRRAGTKVIYMCHGFHFFKGASLPHWLIFYPVERIMAHYCDMIVTINHEDEARAKTFRCPRVEHIDGIGVDLERMKFTCTREEKRAELGVQEDEIMLLSVGELQTRKNHEAMIRAVAKLNDPKVKYVIAGRGELMEYLQKLVRDLGITQQVQFLGYRLDIPDIMNAADIYGHPSRREGLGLACLEAMNVGLPLVTSNVQGIPDYVENGVTGFLCGPTDVDKFAEHLDILIKDESLRRKIGGYNREFVRKYHIAQSQEAVLTLLQNI